MPFRKFNRFFCFHLIKVYNEKSYTNIRPEVDLFYAATIHTLTIYPLLIDPSVRVSLYKDNTIETKETQQMSNDRNPTFNESFDFHVNTGTGVPLSTYSLAVTIMHHSVFRKAYALGHVIFTVNSPQESAEKHLLETESDPHRRIIKWHNLIDPDDI